jgi:mRNA interferase HigB
MRIIAQRTLKAFYEQSRYRDSQAPLESWYAEARSASWSAPADIKEQYRSASIIPGNRVVFNIAGNKYRLVVKIHYNTGIVFIRFIGTHAQYDKINAETI